MLKRFINTALLSIVALYAYGFQIGIPDKQKRESPRHSFKSAYAPSYAVLSINNLTTWMRADGQSNHSAGGDNGTYYPKFMGNVIYQDGLVWAGKAYLDAGKTQPAPTPFIRAGGATYGLVTREGRIIGFGATAVVANPEAAEARCYRIRRDYASITVEELRLDAQSVYELAHSDDVTSAQLAEVYYAYERDWNEWPVAFGAPYIERNGIDGYQPPPPFDESFTVDNLIRENYDEPGIAGPDHTSPADQVVWTVYNDLDETMFETTSSNPFHDSGSLGLEIQKTMWAYKGNNFSGNMYFTRHKILNKGGVAIDSTGTKGGFYIDSLYIAQWSDPDIGSFSDDLIGCDTVLQVGYAYNGNQTDLTYERYSLPPPSVGYYYLQGPIVSSAGDSAVFDLKRRYGYKNLSLRAFTNPYQNFLAEPVFSPLYWWNNLQGYAFLEYPVPFEDHTGTPTFFLYSGDPIAKTGHIDGLGTLYSFLPGDRRMLLSSGPVSLAPGDTQEVLIAVVAGIGEDNLSSVTEMKHSGNNALRAYRSLFSVPRAPAQPTVNALELDRQIILEWGSDIQRVEETENTIIAGDYAFEGYNVYELPSANASFFEGERIATFDIKNGVTTIVEDQFDLTAGMVLPKVVQKGTDSGIQRYLSITDSRFFSEFGTRPLRNGREYYFAVTAYNYAPTPGSTPKVFESTPIIVKVKPRIPFGEQYQTAFGDTLNVSHIEGPGTASVLPIVINPAAGTGDTYEVRVDTVNGAAAWLLWNTSTNSPVLENQTNISGDENYHIVEGGILLKVIDATVTPKIAGSQTGLKHNNVFGPGDVFTYVAPAPQAGPAVQKESARRVGVYPNPFYADASYDLPGTRRIVTFNNLPERATIRIFNLAGHLVRTLEKNNISQFLEWNLTNEHNWQVAAGIYVCHVEMPDIGESKILKLAIIQPQIIPGY